MAAIDNQQDDCLDFSLGKRDTLVIDRRYETLSIVNDFIIGFLFLIGSIFFFYSATETAGVWLFVIGSAQLLIRPSIRLAHNIHIKKLGGKNWDM
ncbi:YrhK family protein [Acidithiobacillus sp. AMEEHan]|uniref:YrhK family protein n=1 Tax=Acidithiobacillus sp. AMEEHan TaxID=2994951 RepID=UPI0027E533AB|nr:YrhK family protein [Acidithiobacillus sp. AMEEHan]